ncbi:MAG: TonB-dependent receptor [Gammaproteobacteria bacterium]
MIHSKVKRWAWIGAAFLAVIGPVTATAQTDSAAPATALSVARVFDIPAMPLAQAAIRFSEQAGVQLVFDAPLAKGIEAKAVTGRMTVKDALTRMLAGTGVTWRYLNSGAVTLERAPDVSGARVLGPVRVQGASEGRVAGVNGSTDATATEGTKSYTSGALGVASKMPQSMKETPQSVTVITQQRMRDQNITDFNSALRQATGITAVPNGSALNPVFYSRGFSINTFQIDGGAPLTTSSGGTSPQIDMAQYDHVEVLRGAAGLFNYYGDPSATINLVRKRPLDHPQVTLETQAGSWNNYRAVLDASAPLAFDGKLRGRAVMVYQDTDHFYDIAGDSKALLYGIGEYDLGPETVVRGGISATRQQSVPWLNGLPRYQSGADLRLPRSTCLCFSWNRWNFDTTELFAQMDRALGERWSVKVNLTRNVQDITQKIGYGNGAINPLTGTGSLFNASMGRSANQQSAGDATLAGSFELFGQRQEIVAGINYSNSDGGGLTQYSSLIPTSGYVPYPGGPVGVPPINVFAFNADDPLYTEPAAGLPSTRYRELGRTQSGAYLNLKLTAFDRWHLITGLRYSRFAQKQVYDSLCTATTGSCAGKRIGAVYSTNSRNFDGDDLSWPTSISVLYDVTKTLSAYVGYTDIYQNQDNYVDRDLNPLQPIVGSNVEGGLKWEARDGRLNASLSAYRIEQKHWALEILDPQYTDNKGNVYLGGRTEPGGNIRCCFDDDPHRTLLSQGLDLEMSGEVRSGWQVSAGYSWSKNEYRGSTFGANQGQPFASQQPHNLLKIWSSYAFQSGGWLSRLTIGGGVNAQSSAYQAGASCVEYNPPNPTTGLIGCKTSVPYNYTAPHYAVLSARADYRLRDHWNVALNANNITDKRYYEATGSSTSTNWYGDPQNFMLTVRGSF